MLEGCWDVRFWFLIIGIFSIFFQFLCNHCVMNFHGFCRKKRMKCLGFGERSNRGLKGGWRQWGGKGEVEGSRVW